MKQFSPLPDEVLADAVKLRAAHKSLEAAAKAAGITPSSFRNRLLRAAQRGLMGTAPVLPGFRISKTTAVTDEDGNIVREFIQQKPEVGETFEPPDGFKPGRITVLTDSNGRETVKWQRWENVQDTANLVAAIRAAFDDYKSASKLIPAPKKSDADLMSVYPIADQHVGLLSWAHETGENYDLKIGADRLRTCAARLISQSPNSKHAIILNLGDWQHTDDQKNMTPRSGNILDVDGRYFKVLTTGVQLMMDVIELALAKHETVLVRNIPGNHDPHASIALTVALSAFYHNNPRVTIDDDPSDFFFHRFGQTLIGANHGHKMKADRMAMAMATMRREDWGATKHHWFLFGHIHHETVKEVGDVRVESFRTLAAKDAHAASCGYVSGQSLTSVTLHIEDGEIGRHKVNL